MKNRLLFTIFQFLICHELTLGQNSSNYFDKYVCNYFHNQDGDSSRLLDLREGNIRAKEIVATILNQVGISCNFEIKEGNVSNAIAFIKDNKRYIVYDTSFINKIEKLAPNDYSLYTILAHEIAHHLFGHTFSIDKPRGQAELEADYWSGFILFKLGASLEEAQVVINNSAAPYPIGSYPSRNKRLEQIELGWNSAKSMEHKGKKPPRSTKKNPNIKEVLTPEPMLSAKEKEPQSDPDIINPPLITGITDRPKGKISEINGTDGEHGTDGADGDGYINGNFNNLGYSNFGNASVTITVNGKTQYFNTSNNGQNYGDVVSYSKSILSNISLPPIKGISCCLPSEIELTQGPQSIQILAPAELKDLITKTVDNGIWHIGISKGGAYSFPNIKIIVSIPHIDFIEIVGSGSITTKGVFEQHESLIVKITGSGSASLNINTQALKCFLIGSGDINLKGEADLLEIETAGSGDINSYTFSSNKCVIRASGSGDCELNVVKNLNVNASGSCEIMYIGEPIVQQVVTSSAKVLKH